MYVTVSQNTIKNINKMLYNQDFRKLVLYNFKHINSDDIVKYAKLRGGQLK